MAAQNRPRITATTSIILTHPVLLLVRVTADPGFRVASSGPESVFRSGGQAKTAHPPHLLPAERARGVTVVCSQALVIFAPERVVRTISRYIALRTVANMIAPHYLIGCIWPDLHFRPASWRVESGFV
jgi:hypothetical protein